MKRVVAAKDTLPLMESMWPLVVQQEFLILVLQAIVTAI
jgi:hypothetical protein